MSKNALTVKPSKFRSINEIFSVPSMSARLSSFVDEAVKCKQNIQFEKETLKALGDNATEELGIKPEVFRNYVDMVFKNDYVQRRDKYDELSDLAVS